MLTMMATTSRTSDGWWRRLVLTVAFVLLQLLRPGAGDYENTWNFYYEQPCCGSGQSNVGGISINGQHHLRHHRGKRSGDGAKFGPVINRLFLIQLCSAVGS
uniref:Uncharacterized protein n=1 Tax=Anopheles melas TaxID=34690 RepID=A0A182TTT2_9DIPT